MRKNPRPAGYKGKLKRPNGRKACLYIYKNALGQARSKTLGAAMMSDIDAWTVVTKEGYYLLAGTPDPELITFGELRRAWELDGKTHSGEPKSKGTLATEKRNGRLHLSEFDTIAATQLRPKRVKNWLGTKSHGLRDKLRQTVSSIYHYGRSEELIPSTCNPVQDVGSSTITNYEAVVLEPTDTIAILKEINDPLIWTLTVLLACTALRVSEALGLRWSDLKLGGKLDIQRAYTAAGGIDKPKSQASRGKVAMHELLVTVLMDWRKQTLYAKDTDYIFPSYTLKGKKPRSASQMVADYIRPSAEKLGIIDLTCVRFGFHNLRHSLATFLLDQGVHPDVVVRMLRWSDSKLLHTYAHLDKKAVRAQGEMVAKLLPAKGVQPGVQQKGSA